MNEENRMSLGKRIIIAILCLLLIAGGIYISLTATTTQVAVTTSTSATNGSLAVPSGPPAGSGTHGK